MLAATALTAAVLAGCSAGPGHPRSGADPLPDGRTPGAGPTAPATGPRSAAPTRGPGAGPRRVDHVLVLMEENHAYDQVIGSPQAPYLNRLARRYGLATDYVAGDPVGYASLPSYLMLTEGTTGTGVDGTDCSPYLCPQPGANVLHQVARSGRQWRIYAEAMPVNCDAVAAVGSYAARHAPGPYFTDERADCARWDVPLGPPRTGPLARDLAGGRLPAYAMVTPDVLDDMHDGTVAAGDAWLAAWVPRILASPQFRAGHTVLFVTWDEGSGATNHVATLVVAPWLHVVRSGLPFTHYSLLRTTEQLLGLPLLGGARTAGSMVAAFGL